MITRYDRAVRPTAAYSSLAFVTAFFLWLIVLYFLEPEFNPPHLISEYELGRFGWLMSLAFFCLGMGSLCLLGALWSDLQTKGGHLSTSPSSFFWLFAFMQAFQDRRAPWYQRGLIRKPLRKIGVILLHDVECCFVGEIAMVLGK